jgi:uncharacterized protein (DUF1015 family)
MFTAPEVFLQFTDTTNYIGILIEEQLMAEIRPFKGYRFGLETAEDLGRFIAPPYDMLDTSMIDELYDKDPGNIVRVTQNRPRKTDGGNRDRHQRAAETLLQWVEKGVLVRDDAPSVYIYEQRFTLEGGTHPYEVVRTGVVVLVKLVDFEAKVVLPHEATLSGPKQDRYELLDATRTHTEQIFGLLDDTGPFYRLLCSLATGKPDGRFTDVNGVVHSLYRCSDVAAIEKMTELARGKTILIADGHHRYETGLNFYRNNPRPEYAYTMMTLVSTADPGLLIRPFHRLIKKTEPAVDMRKELAVYFTLTDQGPAAAAPVAGFIDSSDDRNLLFLDSNDNHLYGCTLSEEGRSFLAGVFPEHSAAWKELPVSMINVIVINTILGLPLDGHVLHDMVDYVNDVDAGIASCNNSGVYYGGFFIRPATIAMVAGVVESGDRMPQKSTNFYPKIYSGLVLHGMDAT